MAREREAHIALTQAEYQRETAVEERDGALDRIAQLRLYVEERRTDIEAASAAIERTSAQLVELAEAIVAEERRRDKRQTELEAAKRRLGRLENRRVAREAEQTRRAEAAAQEARERAEREARAEAEARRTTEVMSKVMGLRRSLDNAAARKVLG